VVVEEVEQGIQRIPGAAGTQRGQLVVVQGQEVAVLVAGLDQAVGENSSRAWSGSSNVTAVSLIASPRSLSPATGRWCARSRRVPPLTPCLCRWPSAHADVSRD
jgi:hypothetical protein